jgi:DNA-binding MarR family transcriptional regulator
MASTVAILDSLMNASERTAANNPPVRVYRPPTAGPWFDVVRAEEWRQQIAAPTSLSSPMLCVLDFNAVDPTLDLLDGILVDFAARIRSGAFGAGAVVVSSQSPAIRRWVELWAAAEALPIYISESTTSFALIQAKPAMQLSATERTTLTSVLDCGGVTSAPALARQLRLSVSAVLNRLNALERKGLLRREPQAGRQPDVYMDYRSAGIDYANETMEAGGSALS